MVARAARLGVELCGILLANPLMPAAGTLSKEVLDPDAKTYGAVLPKTVTPEPRAGNPPPRIAEAPSGMINTIGLQNPGIERFIEDLDAFDVGLPVIVSVAADTAEDFALLCRRLSRDNRVTAVELNLSCPNVEHAGATFCAVPGSVSEVVAACRKALPDKPLLAKLANENVLHNALASEEAGADALTLINTIPALSIDANERKVFLRGGLSGPAIKPIALRAVYDTTRVVRIPVIGCGGISSGTDVAEFMLAGATTVQVGAASFVREPREILEEFSSYLNEAGLDAHEMTSVLE
ncbi:MAG: dihydroorotate dehydrogenase [Rubrobacteraceae bacterium]